MVAPVPSPAGPAQIRCRDPHDFVVTFSWADTWTDACTREMYMPGDRLLLTMREHPSVGGLLVANPFRSWPVRRVRRMLGQRPAPFLPVAPRQGLVSPTRLRRGPPSRAGAVRSLYASYDRRLRHAADALGLVAPHVITANPFVAAYSPLSWAGPVTYYAIDDWSSHPRFRRLWPALGRANEAIRALQRDVCAVSQSLLDRLAPAGRGIVVPNGVEPGEYSAPVDPPGWFEGLSRPRLLYVGTIDSRLDVAVLRDLAERFRHGTIVLVGLVTEKEAVAPLGTLPNLHIRRPVGRAEVAALVRTADACVMPHVRSPLTETMSPLKFFEYLSGGRPVVATDLPPLRGVDERAVLVEPGRSMADAVTAALEAGPADEADRLRFVATHSWARRHDTILDFALGAPTVPGTTPGEPQPL